MSGSAHALKVSIFLPGRHARLDTSNQYAHVLKSCPCCTSPLVLLADRFGDLGSPTVNHVTVDDHVMTGGWYCSQCGLHLVPGDDVKLFSTAEKVLPRTPTKTEEVEIKRTRSDHKAKPETVPREGNGLPMSFLTRTVAEIQGIPRSNNEEPLSILGEDDFSTLERQIHEQLSEFMLKVRAQHKNKEQCLNDIHQKLVQRKQKLDAGEKFFLERLSKLPTIENGLPLNYKMSEQSRLAPEPSLTTKAKHDGQISGPPPSGSKDTLESGYCSGYTTSSSQERCETPKHDAINEDEVDGEKSLRQYGQGESPARSATGKERTQNYAYSYSTNSLTSNAAGNTDDKSPKTSHGAEYSLTEKHLLHDKHKPSPFLTRHGETEGHPYRVPPKMTKQDVTTASDEFHGSKPTHISITTTNRATSPSRGKYLGEGTNLTSSPTRDLSISPPRPPRKPKVLSPSGMPSSAGVFASPSGLWLDVTSQSTAARSDGSREPSPDRHVYDTSGRRQDYRSRSRSPVKLGKNIFDQISLKEYTEYIGSGRATSPERSKSHHNSLAKVEITSPTKQNVVTKSPVKPKHTQSEVKQRPRPHTNPNIRGPQNYSHSRNVSHEQTENNIQTDRPLYLSENHNQPKNVLSARKELFPYGDLPRRTVQSGRSLRNRRSISAGQVGVQVEPHAIKSRRDIQRSSSTEVLDRDSRPAAQSSPVNTLESAKGSDRGFRTTSGLHPAYSNRPVVKPKPSVAALIAAQERMENVQSKRMNDVRSPTHSSALKRHAQHAVAGAVSPPVSHPTPEYQTALVSPDKALTVSPRKHAYSEAPRRYHGDTIVAERWHADSGQSSNNTNTRYDTVTTRRRVRRNHPPNTNNCNNIIPNGAGFTTDWTKSPDYVQIDEYSEQTLV